MIKPWQIFPWIERKFIPAIFILHHSLSRLQFILFWNQLSHEATLMLYNNNPNHYIDGATAVNCHLQTKQTITTLKTPVHNGLIDNNKYILEHECLKLINLRHFSANKTLFKCERNVTYWTGIVHPPILWYSLCSSNPIPTSTLVCWFSNSFTWATLKNNQSSLLVITCACLCV